MTFLGQQSGGSGTNLSSIITASSQASPALTCERHSHHSTWVAWGLQTSQVQRRDYTPLSCKSVFAEEIWFYSSVYIASPVGRCAAKLEMKGMASWFSFMREPKP